ncbi:hypothetical protein ACWNS2_16805 [Planococcus plakortidis]
MKDSGLLSQNDYFIAFESFAELRLPGTALRISIRGSQNETDLLLNLPGTVDRWHIDFRSYAFYCVTSEDFTSMSGGNITPALHIYRQSDLLTYLESRSNLKKREIEQELTYRHFSFACMEHQVDIISSEKPIIQLLNTE